MTIVELDDEHDEARYVASEIERLATDEGVPRDEIAVFYRVNAQSRVLEDTLVRFEIPYQVIGGTKFYERAEIKDAIAYLSLIANPADAVSFARIVNSPRRGIGETTQGRLLSHANTIGQDIWEVFSAPERVPGLGAAALKAVSRFAETMAGLRERVEAANGAVSVAELLGGGPQPRAATSTRFRRSGRSRPRAGSRTSRSWSASPASSTPTAEVEGESDVRPLEEFLAQISLFTDQDALRTEESLCTLMTLHNAKGLEYEAVFMIGCEEGVFPHMRSLEEGNLEEERRLCYVGVTRARQRLCMTFARRRSLHGGRGYNLPSRFLGEIPEELVERQGAASAAPAGRRRRPRCGNRARLAGAPASPTPRRSSSGSATTSCTPASARGW